VDWEVEVVEAVPSRARSTDWVKGDVKEPVGTVEVGTEGRIEDDHRIKLLAVEVEKVGPGGKGGGTEWVCRVVEEELGEETPSKGENLIFSNIRSFSFDNWVKRFVFFLQEFLQKEKKKEKNSWLK